LQAFSDNPSVQVTLVGTRLLINTPENFIGTATITILASDFNGGVHDSRGRTGRTTFDVSIGSNTVYGTKFWDVNNDGVFAKTERGVDGYRIFVDGNADGKYQVGEAVAYTDVNGDYAIRDIHIRSSPGGKAIVSALNSTDAQGGLIATTFSEAAPFEHAEVMTRTEIIAVFDLSQSFLFNNRFLHGVIVLTPEMTRDNANLNDLAVDITNQLNAAGLGGDIFVQIDPSGRIGFTTSSAFNTQLNVQFFTHIQVVRTTFFADGSQFGQLLQDFNAPGSLGFPPFVPAGASFAPVVIFAQDPTTPNGGAQIITTTELPPFARRDTRTSFTATFTFTVDGAKLGSIALTSAIVANNTQLSDLVADLNQLLTTAGFATQVVASLDGDHLSFSTVAAGSTKSLIVEVQQRAVSIRTTTRLDNTTFDETVGDVTSPGGLGFIDRAVASGSDKPQSSIDVFEDTRTDWLPGTKGNHVSVPISGAGQITTGILFGNQPIVPVGVGASGVTSTLWTPEFAQKIDGADLNVISVDNSSLSLPWTGINRIALALDAKIAEIVSRKGGAQLLANALKVTGQATGAYTFTFIFDPATSLFTLIFAKALPADYFTILVPATFEASQGIASATDFKIGFAVQPGDVNGDGQTNDLDYFRAWRGLSMPAEQRDLRADINGDGKWDDADLALIKANYLRANSNIPRSASTLSGSNFAVRSIDSAPISETSSLSAAWLSTDWARLRVQPAASPEVSTQNSSGPVLQSDSLSLSPFKSLSPTAF
jgi:hypothetical protein